MNLKIGDFFMKKVELFLIIFVFSMIPSIIEPAARSRTNARDVLTKEQREALSEVNVAIDEGNLSRLHDLYARYGNYNFGNIREIIEKGIKNIQETKLKEETKEK